MVGWDVGDRVGERVGEFDGDVVGFEDGAGVGLNVGAHKYRIEVLSSNHNILWWINFTTQGFSIYT